MNLDFFLTAAFGIKIVTPTMELQEVKLVVLAEVVELDCQLLMHLRNPL